MTIETAIAFALALLVWVLIPGPAILTIVGRSLSTGFRPALILIAGVLFGDLFYIFIALFGLAVIGQMLGDFFFVVRILGAGYLIFLGLKLWLAEPDFGTTTPSGIKSDRYKSFLAGFSITLGNPKAILFHLGFLPTFFDLTAISVGDAALIILMFMAVLGGALTAYAYAASRARGLFRDRRKIRILNRSAGTILIGAGIAIAAKR